MRQIERRTREKCVQCGLALVFGAMLDDLEEVARQRGLHAVIGIHKNIPPGAADGIFMSDLITPELRCWHCGADPFEDVEVEYADTCMYCGCTPDVRKVAYYTYNREKNRDDWACVDCPEEPIDEENQAFLPISQLHDAAHDGALGALTDQLNKGINPDAVYIKFDGGYTALMWAAGEGHFDCVRLLLARGAKVNAQTPDGWTALFSAIYSQNGEMVRFLLENGGIAMSALADGMTAYDLARKYSDEDILLLLQSYEK